MAAATPLPAPTDPIENILKILGTLGTGTTTSTTETSGGASDQAQQLIKQIQDSVNPDQLAQLVQSILIKAKETLGPNIAATIGSGARATSDSSLALIQGNAAAKASADSAAAILEAQNNANKLAVQLADTRMAASRRTQSKTGISPAGMGILGLSGVAQLKKLGLKNPFGSPETPAAAPPEQLGFTQEELTGMAGPEQLGLTDAELASSAAVTDVIPASETAITAGSEAMTAAEVAASADAVDASFGIGAAAEGAAAAEGGAAATEGAAAVEAGSAASEGAGIGELVAEGAAAWIICTELHNQKRMPTRYYIYGAKAFAKYPEYGKQAYYVWAIPCVRWLRKYPHSLFSRFLESIFNRRAEYLAAKEGLRGAKKSVLGLLVIVITYSLCWIISRFKFERIDFRKELEKFNAN